MWADYFLLGVNDNGCADRWPPPPSLVTGIMGEDGEAVDLGSYKPATGDDFELLAKAVVSSFARFEKHGLYVQFLETLARELAMSIQDPLDIKRIASNLTALANEKQKLIKEKETKKKKAPVKKAVLNRSEDIYDDVAIEGGGTGGAYDDEFDFMVRTSVLQFRFPFRSLMSL